VFRRVLKNGARTRCWCDSQRSLVRGQTLRQAGRHIDRFSEVLLASDVPFCRLYRGVPKQKLDLFEFASTSVAEARAAATKIVGGQVA
jgi:hypothetical protein